MQPPVVIMVWKQDQLAGLGDLLRGTVHLHALSQQLNFRLIVDTQLHPISNFLISDSHEYSDFVLQNKDNVLNLVNSINGVEEVIKKLLMHPDSTKNPILVISNSMENVNIPPNAHTKSFIRTILIPTEEFKTEFNSMCTACKITNNYSILHLRMGDDDLVKHSINIKKYKENLSIVDAHVKSNDNVLIISDSFRFKQYLLHVRPHLMNRIIPTKPVHLSHSTDKDARMIKETLFDLFLLMNSKSIKTYTIYTWISGFVQWVSHAFNIPLTSINHFNSVWTWTLKQKTPMVVAFARSHLPNVSHVINIKPINLKPKIKPQFQLFHFN